MTQEQHPLDRAVELFVYAPIGMAMFAKDTVPTFMKMFVARGETELEHRRKTLNDQMNQYRTVGQLAVRYGGPEVRKRAEAAAGEVRKRGEQTFSGLVAPTPPVAPATPSGAAPSDQITDSDRRDAPPARPWSPIGGPVVDPAPAVEHLHPEPALAIPDYDQLSASQVVEHLDGLSKGELKAVREYERAHRGRNTILGKIATLTA